MTGHPDETWTDVDVARDVEDQSYIDAVLAGGLDDEWDYDDEPVFDPVEEIALEEADRHLEARAFHLRRIAQAERVAAADVARAQARAERLLDRVRARHGQRAEWHEHAVAHLHEALLRRDPKRKTIDLAHGVLRSVRRGEKIECDDKIVLAWAIEHRPDLIRTTERRSIIKAALDDAVRAGMEIPGVSTSPAHTQFTIDDRSDR